MPTPAYVPLDPNAPAGATQAPDVYAASDLANVRALRDAIITGAMQGWSYSQTPVSSNRPTARIWASGLFRLSMNCTYGGAPSVPLTVDWFWSNDGGATYSQIGARANLTWDAVLVNITAVDTNAGLWVPWLQANYKGVISGAEAIGGHIGQTGAAVHGLGTMSTQSANAVNITGGTVNGATVSNGYVNGCYINGIWRAYPAAPPQLVNNANWDWSATPTMVTANPGFVIPAMVNYQVGEHKRLYVYGGSVTINQGSGARVIFTTGAAWSGNGNILSLLAITWDAVAISIANF